jgi:AbrB family looped-hinge helix DNA binding protein
MREASMKEITTTITQRGQVTIPAEVRRALGLKPRDKVAFTIEDGEVRLAAASFTLETAFGSVRPSRKPEDFEEVAQAAKEAKAEKTARELRQA